MFNSGVILPNTKCQNALIWLYDCKIKTFMKADGVFRQKLNWLIGKGRYYTKYIDTVLKEPMKAVEFMSCLMLGLGQLLLGV